MVFALNGHGIYDEDGEDLQILLNDIFTLLFCSVSAERTTLNSYATDVLLGSFVNKKYHLLCNSKKISNMFIISAID